ncbi:MAG: glycosyltransferase [Paracoccaceae bacterium]
MLALAVVSLLIWLALLTLHRGFWRADVRLPARPRPARAEGVVAVIPARDEAASIGTVLAAHAASDYPGAFSVVVVDDGSRDATRAIAGDRAAGSARRIEVVAGTALPRGWSGKLWAVAQGIEAAGRVAPQARWLLLTDADIVHAPSTLSRLVATAEAEGRVLVSLMARLDTGGGALGRLLGGAYVFFFQKLYPFRAVADPRSRVAGAAGGCVLVERAALEAAGGIGAIRGALIDDCALAAAVKKVRPDGLWLGLAATEVRSLRDTGRLATIWETVARTAFAQLRRSYALVALSTLAMALVYLVPPTATLAGLAAGAPATAVAGVAGWIAMAAAFRPTLALYGGSRALGLALPLAAAVYMAMTLDSARRSLVGRGGPWKGRTYADLG